MRVTTRISHDWLEKGIDGAAGTSTTIERVARHAAENLTNREIGTSFEADTGGCVKLTPLGWGFMIADISLDPLRVVNSELPIPVTGYGLRQGRYIILTEYDGGEDEGELYLSEVFATDKDQLVPMAGFEYEADAVELFAGEDGHGHGTRLTRETVEDLVARGEMTEAALDVDLEHVYLIHPKGFSDDPTMLFQVVAGIEFARDIAESYKQAMEAEADADLIAGRGQSDATPELVRGAVVLASVAEDRSLHAGVLKKGLAALRDMAFSDEDERVIPHTGTRVVRVTTTKTLNDRYLANGADATPLYLEVVMGAVYTLMTNADECEVGRIGGYVYIPSATIIKQISRTAEGSIKNPARSREKLKLLHDAMLLLHSTAIDSREKWDAIGESSTMTSLLSGLQHIPKATYNGTTYTDVWVLPAGTAEHMRRTDALEYVTKYPLLRTPPMAKDWQAAVHLYARELVHEAYNAMTRPLKNSRKEREYGEARRTCAHFFEAVRGDRDPEKRIKAKLMEYLAYQIVAIALDTQEGRYGSADIDKFYLTMEAERDGHRGRGDGAWVAFRVRAWRKLHKPRATLGRGDRYTVAGCEIVRITERGGADYVTERGGKRLRTPIRAPRK